MLEEKILAEGPESVLAFIMEPIGGAATAALVAPDSYFPRIREICDRYGILLIHDEVMSGRRPHRKIPRRRPLELPAGHRRAVEGHRLGLCAARRDGGAATAGRAGARHRAASSMATPMPAIRSPAPPASPCSTRSTGSGCIDNAAAMGEVLKAELEGLSEALPVHRRRARQGPAARRGDGCRSRDVRSRCRRQGNANQRLLDLAYERGLIIYSRRVRGAASRATISWSAPPLIVTAEQIGEIVAILGDALEQLAAELDLPVNR